MARLPRLYCPGAAQYLLQRAAGGRLLFSDPDDYRLFLKLLKEACNTHGFSLHAYVLTPHEVHLLGTPSGPRAAAALLQSIGRVFVPRINRKTGRTGALWEGRYRSTLVDADLLLTTMYFIEGCTPNGEAAESWPWSSLAHHVGTRQDAVVSDHAFYWRLSDTPFERQAAYRALTTSPIEPALVRRIRESVERGWAFGSAAFLAALQEQANRRALPLPRGRPRKLRRDDVLSPITESGCRSVE